VAIALGDSFSARDSWIGRLRFFQSLQYKIGTADRESSKDATSPAISEIA